MPSLKSTRLFLPAATCVSSSSIFLPARIPAERFVPLLIFSRIAAAIASYWVPKSIKSDLCASLLKITTPTFTFAPFSFACACSSLSISNASFSSCTLVDLSSTNTMSFSSFSSADGRESVTWDSKFSSRLVAFLDFEICQCGISSTSTADKTATSVRPSSIAEVTNAAADAFLMPTVSYESPRMRSKLSSSASSPTIALFFSFSSFSFSSAFASDGDAIAAEVKNIEK